MLLSDNRKANTAEEWRRAKWFAEGFKAEVKCAAHLTKTGEAECCPNHGETFLVSDADLVPWRTFSMASFEELISSGLSL